MNWSNVKLIFRREVRDQLRDRRTLFIIGVLPLLIYPLMGMSFFQVAQFIQEHPTRVRIVGREELPAKPVLVEQGRFAVSLFDNSRDARLLEIHYSPESAAPDAEARAALLMAAREDLNEGRLEAVVYFPPGFAERLAAVHAAMRGRPRDGTATPEPLLVPEPEIFFNTAKEKSQITQNRVTEVVRRWREEIGRENLALGGVPKSAALPFAIKSLDVAEHGHRDAAIWSKVLPFLLLVWALTGAFYPAIDLCAGEKERGTLETLLSSPAARVEIVWGKLLTIMLFSVATVVLNLMSLGLTGQFVLSHLPGDIGPPPALTPVWLLAALLPISALFSALCLALAAFARSSKEGQYYLMPLILVTMPLMVLPMAPNYDLNLGSSLIPITGVVLLLRTLLEGNYLHALPFVPPVVAVTGCCCYLAMRWAVDQFNSESVLFRECERLDVGRWVVHLFRDRQETPGVALALFCGVLILVIRFFFGFAAPMPGSFRDFAVLALVTQVTVIATPALLMTVMLTRGPKKTLLLRLPAMWTVPAAFVLAAGLHPAVQLLQRAVTRLYPLNDEIIAQLDAIIQQSGSPLLMLLTIAIAPAICEELAYRGFVLSGFRHLGSKWRAIAFTSLLFAVAHAIFQQSLIAFVVGLVLGYLAVQTRSILPAIVFHATHNSLGWLAGQVTHEWARGSLMGSWLFAPAEGGGCEYRLPAVAVGLLIATLVLRRLSVLPGEPSREEILRDVLDHAPTGPAVAT